MVMGAYKVLYNSVKHERALVQEHLCVHGFSGLLCVWVGGGGVVHGWVGGCVRVLRIKQNKRGKE